MASIRHQLTASRVSLRSVDCLLAVVAPIAAALIRDTFEYGGAHVDVASFSVYVALSAAASLMIMINMGCMRVALHAFGLSDAFRASQAVMLGIIIGAVACFACTRLEGVARAVPFIQAAVQIAGFVGIRILAQKTLLSRNAAAAHSRNVLIVGSSRTAISCFSALRDLSESSLAISGFLTQSKESIGQTIGGKKILGTIADIEAIISTLRIHGVEVSRLVMATRESDLTAAEAAAVARAERGMASPRIDAYSIVADFMGDNAVTDAVADAPAAFGARPIYALVKRTVDVTFATALLVAAAPVMLVLCAVVALDSGMPIIFWQQRLGRNAKPITIFKFRTMRAPLDRAGRLLSDKQHVSSAGLWMRKLRLDELPQLLSIIKGDMSFIGPRPLLPIDQPSDASGRLSVRPGLTGWAQVHGGILVSAEDKNALDLWYVGHAGIALDVAIVIQTLRTVLKGDRLHAGRIEQARRWSIADAAASRAPQPARVYGGPYARAA